MKSGAGFGILMAGGVTEILKGRMFEDDFADDELLDERGKPKKKEVKKFDLAQESFADLFVPIVLKASAHPGFDKVAARIAGEQNVSMDRAKAMLAAGSRGASAAAKKKNPRLKKV